MVGRCARPRTCEGSASMQRKRGGRIVSQGRNTWVDNRCVSCCTSSSTPEVWLAACRQDGDAKTTCNYCEEDVASLRPLGLAHMSAYSDEANKLYMTDDYFAFIPFSVRAIKHCGGDRDVAVNNTRSGDNVTFREPHRKAHLCGSDFGK